MMEALLQWGWLSFLEVGCGLWVVGPSQQQIRVVCFICISVTHIKRGIAFMCFTHSLFSFSSSSSSQLSRTPPNFLSNTCPSQYKCEIVFFQIRIRKIRFRFFFFFLRFKFIKLIFILKIICFIKSICENINAYENYMFYYLGWKKNVLKIREKNHSSLCGRLFEDA